MCKFLYSRFKVISGCYVHVLGGQFYSTNWGHYVFPLATLRVRGLSRFYLWNYKELMLSVRKDSI